MKFTEVKMFRFIYKTSIPVLVLIIFGFQTALLSPDGYAQGIMKVSDDIGGSGGTTNGTQDSGGNSTTLIIVGGVVIAGILLYTLVLHKSKPKKEEKQDSTSSQSLLLKSSTESISGAISENIRKIQEFPVNLYVGFQKGDPVIPERKFIMGISCRF